MQPEGEMKRCRQAAVRDIVAGRQQIEGFVDRGGKCMKMRVWWELNGRQASRFSTRPHVSRHQTGYESEISSEHPYPGQVDLQ